MPRPLTRRQSEVFRFIRGYVEKYGFPPTLREIAEKFDIHHNAAAGHVASLERKKVLRRTPGLARGLVLIGGKDGR
jgi:repressor LexA